jgi:hypothetical protein
MYIVIVYEDGIRWYYDGAGLSSRRIDSYRFTTESEAQTVADIYGGWVGKY